MKVSAQEEYGLRCLMQMARTGAGRSVSISEISRAEGLSAPNVAKLMRILRLGGLVRSVRGQAGGYTLARPAEDIMLDEVLQVLGDPLFGPDFCQQHIGTAKACIHTGDCSMRPVWKQLQRLVNEVLARTSLQDMLRGEEAMAEWISLAPCSDRGQGRNSLAGMASH